MISFDDFDTLADPAASPTPRRRNLLPPMNEDQLRDLEDEIEAEPGFAEMFGESEDRACDEARDDEL